MVWFFTIVGIAVVAVGLNDVFHTLFHPSGRGRLSFLVVNAVWRISRSLNRRHTSLTGSVAIAAVITIWAILQIVGWALIYYPHIPEGFSYTPGVDPARYPDFSEAIYISIVTLSTLGYGDAIPIDPWLRLISPLQAVAGFGLLSAAVSWFMQIYPALARQRALALRLTLLRKSLYASQLDRMDAAIGAQLLQSLAHDIVQVRVDLAQNGETYYFRESDEDASLPAAISYAFELCEMSRQSKHFDVRLAGDVLQAALDDLGAFLRAQFMRQGDSTREVFRSFASDHGHAGDREG